MKNILFVLILLLGHIAMSAQSTLQVVTKTVQKTLDWKLGYTVEINGEKAEILIESALAGSKSVQVKAEMTARHPQLDSAQLDLKAWKFVTSTIGKKIYIRAYIGLPSGQALPNSNLKVKIVVQVPDLCPVILANKFGKARLEHLTGSVFILGEFCALTLVDLKGGLRIESQYGNVDGYQLGGQIDIQTKRSAINLTELRGNCSLHSEFGAISISNSPQMGNLFINANKGDVTLSTSTQPPHYNFTLTVTNGDLKTPVNPSFIVTTDGNTKQASLHQGASLPQVTVAVTLGKITIQ